MKHENYLFSTFMLLALVILSFASCKKTVNEPDPAPTGNTPGLEVKAIDNKTLKLPVDSGDVGLVVDTREIFKKGYTPAYASVQISGSLASYSNDHLEIDQNTNLAIISIKKQKLTDKQLDDAAVGPKTVIKIYDDKGKILANLTESSLPINDKNKYYEAKTTLGHVKRRISFNPEVPYIIQANISSTGKPEVLTFDGEESTPVVRKAYKENNVEQQFYFIPANKNNPKDDSTYYIRTSLKGQNGKYYYLDIYNDYSQQYQLFAYNDDPSSSTNYKFILRRDDSGWVYIKPAKFPLLKDNSPSFSPYEGKYMARFKIITGKIQWDVTDLGSEFNQPIMPMQKLELAVSNQLVNCSNGKLSQTLGKEESRVQTTSLSTAEEFQLTTSQNVSIGISTSVSAEGSFFGTGVSASIGINTEYSYGRSVTSTQGKTIQNSDTETKTTSTSRTVDVLPNSGVNVYDAIESYPNVRIPFVQTLRVAGTYNGIQLSGDEIVDQLMKNQFGGVVSKIASSFVLITIRGTAIIDNYMHVKSNVVQIPGACNP